MNKLKHWNNYQGKDVLYSFLLLITAIVIIKQGIYLPTIIQNIFNISDMAFIQAFYDVFGKYYKVPLYFSIFLLPVLFIGLSMYFAIKTIKRTELYRWRCYALLIASVFITISMIYGVYAFW